jgi:hypothetical protein
MIRLLLLPLLLLLLKSFYKLTAVVAADANLELDVVVVVRALIVKPKFMLGNPSRMNLYSI